MNVIDRLAYSSGLRQVHPACKLTLALLALVACLAINWVPFSLFMALIAGVATVAGGRVPLGYYLKVVAVPGSFIVLSLLMVVFEIAPNAQGLVWGAPLFGGWIGFSWHGIGLAVHIFFRTFGAASCLLFLSLTTPIVEVIWVLRSWRMPAVLLEMMAMIYRFVFVLWESAETMYHAQSARLGYARIGTGFRSLGSLFTNLFVRAYRRSDELYLALAARGYEEELAVVSSLRAARWSDYALAVGLVAMPSGMAIVLRIVTGGGL